MDARTFKIWFESYSRVVEANAEVLTLNKPMWDFLKAAVIQLEEHPVPYFKGPGFPPPGTPTQAEFPYPSTNKETWPTPRWYAPTPLWCETK